MTAAPRTDPFPSPPKGQLRPAAFLAMVFAVLLLAGCAATRAPVEDRSRHDGPRPASYEIRRGDTLYSIAWRYGLNYHELARWNRISPPYLIYPGQRLRLHAPGGSDHSRVARAPAPTSAPPSQEAAAASTTATGTRALPSARSLPAPAPLPSPRSAPGSSSGSDAAQPAAPPAVAGVRPPAAVTFSGRWQTPANGRIIRSFSAGHGGNKGVDIAGEPGQSVRASAAGTVVYAGSGLRQYGKLVILRHDEHYLSAYGYLGRIDVSEGEAVAAGAPLAAMGYGPDGSALLHFEIRRDGHPVDPSSLVSGLQ